MVAGEYQTAAVHALAHAMNAALGNVGKTLYYTEPLEGDAGNLDCLRAFARRWLRAKWILLLMFGGNPVYNAPHDLDFVNKIEARFHCHSLEPVF